MNFTSQSKILVLLFSIIWIDDAFTQNLEPGDIAFTAYNVDGGDDFAIVLLKDIVDDTLYFTDFPVNGAGGLDKTVNEGVIRWITGMSTISAGTVIVFTDASSAGGVTAGSVTEIDLGFNLAAGGDAILAFQGSDECTPTSFIAGIQNETGNFGDTTNTNLGCAAYTITNGANDDGAIYTGPRNTESSFVDYIDSLKVLSNWITSTLRGDTLLPFDTTSFSIIASCTAPLITGRDTSICPGDSIFLNDLLSGSFEGELTYGTSFGIYPDTITKKVSPTSSTTYYVRDSVLGMSCVDTAQITIVVVGPDLIAISPQTNSCPSITVDLAKLSITDVNTIAGIADTSYYVTTMDAVDSVNSLMSSSVSSSGLYFIRYDVAGCFDTVSVQVNIETCIPPCDIDITFADTICNADATYTLKIKVDSTGGLSDKLIAIIDGNPVDTLDYPAQDGDTICISTGLFADGTTGVELIIVDSAKSEQVVFSESFETDGNGTRYTTSIPEFKTSDADFFGRLEGSNVPGYNVTGSSGNFFFAIEDVNDNMAVDIDTLKFMGIDISLLENLFFKGLFAEEDADDGNEDWDANTEFIVEVQIDGEVTIKYCNFRLKVGLILNLFWTPISMASVTELHFLIFSLNFLRTSLGWEVHWILY